MLWGSPGIGKSEQIYDACRIAGLSCNVVYPATRQPEDFSGVVVPNGAGGGKVISILAAVNELVAMGTGVLFFDEINGGRPAVQAAMMSVALDRRVGDVVLPPAVRILAAANPVDEATGGWELDPPMANRFAHIEVPKPTISEWCAWLLKEKQPNYQYIGGLEEKLKKAWPEVLPRMKGLTAGFMQACARGVGIGKDNKGESTLHSMPNPNSKDRGRAWPSPRMWVMAIRAAATAVALEGETKGSVFAHELVGACIGKGLAAQWAEWIAKADLPDPVKVLNEGWKPDKARIDRTYAVYGSMASYVVNRPDVAERKKLAPKAYKLLIDLFEAKQADLVVDPMQTLVESGLGPKSCKEAHDLFVKMGMSEIAKHIPDPQ